jgi:hypothetical protein
VDEKFHNLLVDGQKTYNPPLHGRTKSITILFLDDVHARKKRKRLLCIMRDEGRANQKLENL